MHKLLSVLLFAALILTGCGKKAANVEQEFFEKPDENEMVQQQEIKPVEEAETETETVSETRMPVEDLTFETVYFEFDAHSLTPQAREILAGHVQKLNDYPEVKLLIEGHCDERGTVEYNLALGDKRAHTVKTYMVNSGIDGKRLSTISYGKEKPVDTAHTEEAWAKNRRAVFVIMP